MRQRVAIIVPAYNEEGRIGRVLRAVANSRTADEVIVVCDGCIDRTAEVSRRWPGVRVVELPFNAGKGGAMAAGVRSTEAEIIAFVDADLDGLEAEHVDSIIRPLLGGHCEMCIGVFRGGKFWSDAAQMISPYISGQRAMKRKLFESVPFLSEMRMGVEIAINDHAKRVRARVLRVVLQGVSNCHKEQKLGLVKGIKARGRMYQEMLDAKKRARQRRRWRERTWLWP